LGAALLEEPPLSDFAGDAFASDEPALLSLLVELPSEVFLSAEADFL
jgi:hypothetical protein